MHTTLKNIELLKHFKISKIKMFLIILRFLTFVCISWKLKCWILLMHGVTMKYTDDA